jgi:hypothetical protein
VFAVTFLLNVTPPSLISACRRASSGDIPARKLSSM